MFLSRFAREVIVLVRGPSLAQTMSRYLVDQIEATDHILVRTGTEVARMTGTDHLETVTVRDRETGAEEGLAPDAVFVFIGASPCSNLLQGLGQVDEAGFVLTAQDLVRDGRRTKGWRLDRDPFLQQTSVPGIFAAGDVRHDVIRRVASAVGQGSVAVSLVHKYLETV